MVRQPSQLCRYHYDPLDRLAKRTLANNKGTALYYCQHRVSTQTQDRFRHSILQVDDHLLAQLQIAESGLDISLLATEPQR